MIPWSDPERVQAERTTKPVSGTIHGAAAVACRAGQDWRGRWAVQAEFGHGTNMLSVQALTPLAARYLAADLIAAAEAAEAAEAARLPVTPEGTTP